MGEIRGERSVEIAAPIGECFAIAADIQGAPEWQQSLEHVDVIERDADKRASLVETSSDARVKTVNSTLRFTYDEPRAIEWVQEKGDVKALQGYWRFEELGPDSTRATYGLVVDPGRMLGMLLRGPAEAKVRDLLLGGAAEGLKSKVESG
jgi:uncharacterized membrane protein